MISIEELKKKSGVQKFASVLGKSTIAKDHPAYVLIEKATETLIDAGYGVLHGGYAGGAMSAASDTAERLIRDRGLPKEINIGVPQFEHDGLWARVENASFTNPAEDIFARLRGVTSGDIVVICPLGGDGTELEESVVFHENVIRMGLSKYSKNESKKPVPLIFLQISGGTDWRKIIETKMACLDTKFNKPSDYDWLYFVNSLEDFKKLIKRLS